MDDLAADAEVLEHAFEHAGIVLEHLVGEIDGTALMTGLGQEGKRRQADPAARSGGGRAWEGGGGSSTLRRGTGRARARAPGLTGPAAWVTRLRGSGADSSFSSV